MVNTLGLDIGGANTKAAFVSTQNSAVIEFKSAVEYFPFWRRDAKLVCDMLSSLRKKLVGSRRLDCVAVTMTAEVSDVYSTKRQGVNHILDCVSEAFGDVQPLVLDVDANLRSISSAREYPLKVASANWVATGWMVTQKIQDGVVVDVGSTTTSIIPIVQGKVCAAGKTDLEKLISRELIYTGSLRTNVAAIVSCLPLRGSVANVASELFAQSGDIHLVLGNIKKMEYSTETADGKGKTINDSLARIAHVVCADTEMLTTKEILKIAKHVYKQQVKQIADGLDAVYCRLETDAKQTVPTIVTGLGKHFLAMKAAENVGVAKIIDLGHLFTEGAALASPATGIALIAATKIEGRNLEWTQ